jgi:tetratricopeptide (TPR) repeat protein
MVTPMKTIMLAALMSAVFSAPMAFAAASGGSSEPAATDKPLTKKQVAAKAECKKKGRVWNMKKLICENAQSGSLDDESLYNAGREFALDGRYDEAINTLNYVANAQDKRVLNYLGYSYRKSGHIDVGLTYYKQALAVDPDYTLVREYLGEALIQMGDISGAKGQLLEIQKRCKGACPEYAELAKQLAPYN